MKLLNLSVTAALAVTTFMGLQATSFAEFNPDAQPNQKIVAEYNAKGNAPIFFSNNEYGVDLNTKEEYSNGQYQGVNPKVLPASKDLLITTPDFKVYMTLPSFIKGHITDTQQVTENGVVDIGFSMNNTKPTDDNWQGLQVTIVKGLRNTITEKSLPISYQQDLANIKKTVEKNNMAYDFPRMKEEYISSSALFNIMDADVNKAKPTPYSYELLSRVDSVNKVTREIKPYMVANEVVKNPAKDSSSFKTAFFANGNLVVLNYSYMGTLSLERQQDLVRSFLTFRLENTK